MLKRNLLLLLAFSSLGLAAQVKPSADKLFYFISKDSLLGVKDAKGKVIIPPNFHNYFEIKNRQTVREDPIFLFPAQYENKEPNSFGVMYNHKGEFLFAPYMWDNGPDMLNEGLMRFVKDKKVGFANRAGEIVIPAKYDFADMFSYGIASYCNGCYRDRSKDSEHPPLKGGTWGYINIKGEELKPTAQAQSPKDQKADPAGYLPYQFKYTAFEEKIIDSFTKLSIISKLHFVNYEGLLDNNEKQLHYEIVERPSSFYPYYHITGFEYSKEYGYHGYLDDDIHFLISKDGKKYYSGTEVDNKVPLDQWIKKKTKEAKDYLKAHPEAKNKL